ncbi:MAG: AsmA family protein [gamma proteobacterium symbiont of Bathyaustriella thionipta]|nr:AsmA family protein [gamma proteobacterium symbiont of Bathyaustriella thionipta]
MRYFISKYKSFLKVSLTALLALLFVGLLLTDTLLNRYKKDIAELLSAALHRQVSIEGDLTLHWLPRPALSAGNIKITNPDWSNQADLVSAEQLSISIKLSLLLHQHILIEQLRLTDVTLNLEQQGKKNNWQFSADPAAQKNSASSWHFDGIQRLQIENLSISHQSDEEAAHYFLSQAHVSMPPDQPMQASARIRVHNGWLNMQAETASLNDWLTPQPQGLPLSIEIQGQEYQFQSRHVISQIAENQWRIDNHVNIQNNSQLFALLSLPDIPLGDSELSAQIDYQTGSVLISRLQAQATWKDKPFSLQQSQIVLTDEILATLQGSYDNAPFSLQARTDPFRKLQLADTPWQLTMQGQWRDSRLSSQGSISLQNKNNQTEYHFDLKGQAGESKKTEFQYQSQGNYSPDTELLTLDKLQLNYHNSRLLARLKINTQHKALKITGQLSSQQFDLEDFFSHDTHAKSPGFLDTALDIPFGIPVETRLRIEIRKLKGLDADISDLQTEFNYGNERLNLDNFRLSLPGGSLKGRLQLQESATNNLSVNLGLSSDQFILADLFDKIQLKHPFRGRLSRIKMQLKGSGSTLGEILSSSTAQAGFDKSDFNLNTGLNQPRVLHLQKAELRVSPSSSVQIDAAGQFGGKPVTTEIKLGRSGQLLRNQGNIPLNIKVFMGENHGLINGSILLPLNASQVNLNYQVEGKHLGVPAAIFGLNIEGVGSYDLSGKLTMKDRVVTLNSNRGHSMGGKVATNLLINFAAQPVAMKGNISIERLNLDPILAARSTAGSEQKKIADIPFDSSRLRGFDLDGEIDVQHVLRKKVDIGSIQVKLHLQQGKMHIDPISINMGKIGKLSAEVLIDGSSDITHLRLKAHSDEIDYGQLLRKVRKSKDASGKLYLDAQLESDGNSTHNLIKDSHGKVLIYGGKGVLGKTDLFVTLNAGNLLNAMIPKFLKQDRRAKLKCFYTQWNIDKSVVYSQDSLFRFSELDIALVGKYNPIKRKINILISPKARGFQILDVAVPVQIKGPIDNPGFIPGALPSVSVLGLSELNLQEPGRLFKLLKPIKDLFKPTDGDKNINPCVEVFREKQSPSKSTKEA